MSRPEQRSFWAGLESRYQPFGTASILEDSRVMVRLPVFAGLGSALNALSIGAFVFSQGEEAAGALAAAAGVVYLGATVDYWLSGNAKRMTHILLWASVANNVGLHIVLGGFAWSGLALGWGVLITASSALFLSGKTTLTIGSTYLLAAVVLGFLEPRLRTTRDAPPVIVSTLLAIDMFAFSLLLLAPMTTMLVEQIGREQARANRLLLNVLPDSIAKRLKRAPGVIADEFDECTILFADIAGFTKHSRSVSPERLVEELNHVFSRFDSLARSHRVEKIKTIGDGYMAVAGAPDVRDEHAEVICDLALDMKEEIPTINEALGTDFRIRIGINTGRVVAGVIGTSRFSYDLWGDAVNVASRMESQGQVGEIQVTKAVVDKAGTRFSFEPLGMLEVRGSGAMPVYLLTGRRGDVAGGSEPEDV